MPQHQLRKLVGMRACPSITHVAAVNEPHEVGGCALDKPASCEPCGREHSRAHWAGALLQGLHDESCRVDGGNGHTTIPDERGC